MNHALTLGAALALGAASIPACGAPPNNIQSNKSVDQPTLAKAETSVPNNQRSVNQRFLTIDEYLVYLEKVNAPIDKPWYREIRPGVYELVTGGNLRILGTEGEQPRPKRTFTREELERKFGFRK
jgi:hypothetical protein